jgi:hypothetical protein
VESTYPECLGRGNEPDDTSGGCALTDVVLADPRFCDPEQDEYALQRGSPCSDEVGAGCGRIGAVDVGCEAVSVESSPAAVPWVRVGPSPFRDTLLMWFQPRVGGPIRVDIYDTAGRRVRTISREDPELIIWDGRSDDGASILSGTYFVHITGIQQNRCEKVTLLR